MDEIPDTRVPVEPITRKLFEDYLKVQGLSDQVSPEECERFIVLGLRFQLNPFLRELHLVASTDKGKRRWVAVVGYEVYLRKAERTGKLDGWKAWTTGEGEDLKAVLEIYRHDWAHPFVHEVHYAEAVQKTDDGTVTSFWKRMPTFQLRKVCISQGFRLCFPEDLGGIPYEPAELSLDEVAPPEAPKPVVKNPPVVAGPKSAFAELDEYLANNSAAFTGKHLRWIQTQLEKTPTLEKAKAMLGYARKVVLQGGDPTDEPRSPRTYGNRNSRRQETVPEPIF